MQKASLPETGGKLFHVLKTGEKGLLLRILLRPAVETGLDELDRLLVRFVTVLADLHGGPELEPHGPFRVERAHVAKVLSGGEEVGLQGTSSRCDPMGR